MLTLGLTLLLTASSVVLAEPLHYVDCGSEAGIILEVNVTPCPKQPCILHKGETYTVNVTFISKIDSPGCEAKVFGEMFGVDVPFPLDQPDGCKSGISCPIQAGHTYSYLAKLPVKPEYPNIKLVVVWRLSSNNGQIFCWKVAAQISS